MKTNNFNFYLYASFIVLILTSCSKVIDLKLGNDTGKLVIEGNFTNILGPQMVKLTTNVPFSNPNNYPPVTGATVTVSDNTGNNYKLAESPAGTYSINQVAGISGKTYTMSVLFNGKTYTANSVMPNAVKLDSLAAQNDVFDSNKHRKNIIGYFQDPAGIKNQYRFLIYVNNTQVKSVFAYNDDFTDGRYVTIDFGQGLREADIDIYAGDIIKVEMQCIDKPVYTYWYTLMQQAVNGPGGGVTPTNPPTNITPETLGYFSAHTTQSLTFVVK